jgi:hypothetical protein
VVGLNITSTLSGATASRNSSGNLVLTANTAGIPFTTPSFSTTNISSVSDQTITSNEIQANVQEVVASPEVLEEKIFSLENTAVVEAGDKYALNIDGKNISYTVKTTGSTGIWGTNVTNSEAKQKEDEKKSESNDSSQAEEEEQEPVSPWDDTIGIGDQFETYASGIEQSLGSGTRTQSRQGFHFYLDSKTSYPDGVEPGGNFPADSYIKVMTRNMFSASYYKDGKIDINFVKSDIERAPNHHTGSCPSGSATNKRTLACEVGIFGFFG